MSCQTSHLHLWRNLSLSLVLSFLHISPFPFYPRCLLLSGLFFSSSFNLLLSCLLSIIFFAPCPQPVMAQTLNLSIFSSSSSLLPGALWFFFTLFLSFLSPDGCAHMHTLFPHSLPSSFPSVLVMWGQWHSLIPIDRLLS